MKKTHIINILSDVLVIFKTLDPGQKHAGMTETVVLSVFFHHSPGRF